MSARQYYVMQGSSLSGHESLKTGLGTGKTIAPQKKRYPLCHAFIHFIRGSCRFQCVLPSQLLQWACNLHCLPKQARGMACDELQSLRLLHRRILGVPCQSMSCAVYAVTVSSGSKARARTCPPPLPHGVFLLLLQCAGREVLIQETLHEAWKYCE